MKILLVNKYWRKLGGVEEYCFHLKDVLEELGHEVIPFAQLEADTLDVPSRKYFVSEVDPTAPGARQRLRTARRAILGDETTRAIKRLLAEAHLDIHALKSVFGTKR